MKLVPLGDRVVLKQLKQKRLQNPESFFLDRHRKNHSRQRLSQ